MAHTVRHTVSNHATDGDSDGHTAAGTCQTESSQVDNSGRSISLLAAVGAEKGRVQACDLCPN